MGVEGARGSWWRDHVGMFVDTTFLVVDVSSLGARVVSSQSYKFCYDGLLL